MEERFLPIDIQDFEKLRKGGYVYVDKTKYVYELARLSTPFFLSRPRRFGKSLLLSTFEAFFLGKKELFDGLYISEKEKDWTEWPVIKISFGMNSYENNERLKERLNAIVTEHEDLYKITKQNNDSAERFAHLIHTISEQTGKQVVILIDEYDKPILDALYTDFEEQNRQELRSFYSPLKDCDKYIRFLFITGSIKLAQTNFCNELDYLNDISLNENFSSICGISEKELNDFFMPEIEQIAKAKNQSVSDILTNLRELYGVTIFLIMQMKFLIHSV